MAGSKLNHAKIQALKIPGTYGDGDGLWFRIRPPNLKDWVYRYNLYKKPHWMGLGSYSDVTLAEARVLASEARKLVKQGVDPILTRQAKIAELAAQAGLHTFADVADAYLIAHESSWKNPKHKAQWRTTLDTYVLPKIGKIPVAAIDTDMILKILNPIWKTKTETASRVRGRIEVILAFATARKWRTGENVAVWRGHLDTLLAKPSKISAVKHHPALPWKNIAGFMGKLVQQDSVSGFALRFTILTTARTNETTGAKWSEFDLQDKIWNIPGIRMKAGRDHRVPLSEPVIQILSEMQKLRERPNFDGYVFPGAKKEKPLSNMAMLMMLRRMDDTDITVHGFRSTFRDWVAEDTNHQRELAEIALAHTLSDKTEAAYQRGDMFDKRRKLMADWALKCSPASE